jgi:protease-4
MIRKHPVFFGLFILFITGFIFILVVYGLSSFGSKRYRTLSLGEKVGVVPIEGVIAESKEIVEQLNAFRQDEGIKAVVLRIDSPGGGVASSQEIYGAVLELKKKKKVVASMGSLAASGGYLIACGADKIVANPGTITGSISAIMQFANVEELFKKIGVKGSVIKSGKYKDMGSPLREMTDEEKILIQGLVDDIYDQFLDVVVQSRHIPKEELKRIADGRVFSGRQAKNLKLVDELGDLNAAVSLAGQLSGIAGTPETVYPVKKRESLADYFLQGMMTRVMEEIRGKSNTSPVVSYIYRASSP